MERQPYNSAQEVCREVLRNVASDTRESRWRLLLAHLESSYGRRMSPAKLEQRANLVLKYKGQGPLWLSKHGTSEVLCVKKCIDFAAPGLFIRCLGKNDELLVLDPDKYRIENETERACRVAEQSLEKANRDLALLQESLRNTRAYAESLEQRITAINARISKSHACLTRVKERNQKPRQRWFPIAP